MIVDDSVPFLKSCASKLQLAAAGRPDAAGDESSADSERHGAPRHDLTGVRAKGL